MVRYSFPVGLFHSLLHAGLSRRTDTILGLKLERRKGPMQILVVDSVQQTPTEN